MKLSLLPQSLALLLALGACAGTRVHGHGDDAVARAGEQAAPGRSTEEKLSALERELRKEWPENRTVRFVFHGHSVPAGYFRTPNVRRFDSYPSLVHRALCEQYPTATIDACVTAIGGENSVKGAARFGADVLALKPDVVLIDYALNDRGVGLPKAREAWSSMIRQCLARDILVVLLTPTPDANEPLGSEAAPLARHSEQIRSLGAEHGVPVVDSYGAFESLAAEGEEIRGFLAQSNHPNRAGHGVVAELITKRFVVDQD